MSRNTCADCDLDDTTLDLIEQAAKGNSPVSREPFASPDNTLALVAEVRRLRAQVADMQDTINVLCETADK